MIPVKEKEAVLAMYRQGQKYKEIADLLLLSPNTVKSICRRSGIKPLTSGEADPGRCRNCGMPLSHTAGAKQKLFCSDRCRYAWWNKKRGLMPYRLTCSCCGQEFISYGNKKTEILRPRVLPPQPLRGGAAIKGMFFKETATRQSKCRIPQRRPSCPEQTLALAVPLRKYRLQAACRDSSPAPI